MPLFSYKWEYLTKIPQSIHRIAALYLDNNPELFLHFLGLCTITSPFHPKNFRIRNAPRRENPFLLRRLSLRLSVVMSNVRSLAWRGAVHSVQLFVSRWIPPYTPSVNVESYLKFENSSFRRLTIWIYVYSCFCEHALWCHLIDGRLVCCFLSMTT